MRSGLHVPVTREAEWRPLSERTVNAFIDALNASPLNAAMASLAIETARSGGTSPFSREGINRSRMIRLKWRGVPDGWPSDRPGAVEAIARLEVPGAYGHTATHMQILIDIIVRHSAAADILRERSGEGPQVPILYWRIGTQRLGQLIGAMLATLTHTDLVGPLGDLAGVDPTIVPQPRVLHVVTARPITEVLDINGLRLIPDSGVSNGTHLLGDPALDLTIDADRQKQVKLWLTQTAGDAGLLGMEQMLSQIDLSSV